MIQSKKTIQRFRGDSYPVVIRIKQNGAPVDITGCSFMLSVTTVANKGSEVYEFQSVGSIVGSPGDGVVSFPVLAADVDSAGTYCYDVQMTDQSSYVRTIMHGDWLLVQEITQ